MLKFRIRKNALKPGLQDIPILYSEMSNMPGKDGENTNLVVCHCNTVEGIEENMVLLGRFTVEQSISSKFEPQQYKETLWLKVNGVDETARTFTTIIPRYVDLKVERFYVSKVIDDAGNEYRILHVLFQSSHYISDNFNEQKEIEDDLYVNYVDENGYYIEAVLTLKDYDTVLVDNKSIDINLDKIIASTDKEVHDFGIFLENRIETPPDWSTIYNTTYIGEVPLSQFVFKRDTLYFGEHCGYTVSMDRPSYLIEIPVGKSNAFGLMRDMEIQNIVQIQKKTAINPIGDMEKDMYYPMFKDTSGNFKPIYKIRFNLHFREHRGENWKVDPASYWNGTIVDDTSNELRLMKNSDDTDEPFYSYKDGSCQSDLISYLNFTNNDVKYQKNRLKKSFIRLSCYDSDRSTEQNLLCTSTVFLDAGNLFAKQIRNMETEPYASIIYNGYKISEVKTDLVSAKVDREPYGDALKSVMVNDDIEDKRISSQFVIEDTNNSQSSSEGFYQYFWKDVYNGTEPQPIYMKVEFNHAGFGVTTPFMMPFWDPKKWNGTDRASKQGIKTFQEIVDDWNDVTATGTTDGPYGIKQYMKFMYIRWKYQYDSENDKHVYYLDDETYGDVDDTNGNKGLFTYDSNDGSITLNLYEAKIDDERNTVTRVANGSNDRGEII